MKPYRQFKWLLTASLVTAMSACVANPTDTKLPPIDPSGPQVAPPVGASEFVSADGRNGEATQDNREGAANNGAAAPDEAGADLDAAEDPRTVEEGDIYRVLEGSDLILNLNAYRGLQIIDFSDVANPDIIGKLQVSGTPVEMYSVGDRVYVLLNNWRGYWGSRDDVAVDTFEGGLVLAIDVSDRANPTITGQATIPGYIRTSRLTRGNGEEALFVVTSEWDTSTTYVQSYSVSSGGRLAAKSRIDLDTNGYLTDIQASPDLLMVARWDWNQQARGSEVTVIDISNPNGSMVEGGTVKASGMVTKKTNMDHSGNILRIVSGNDWSNQTNTNHVETFDITDIQTPTLVDQETFGDGENLYATVFVDNKAFFVTYLRVDPFHAFSIDDAGQIEEKSEFIVSGWNDFFKPVSQNKRLVGIGHNDENGWDLSVSLYDIEDLTNPNPLIDREDFGLDGGWSEANWDDRAFTVLEKGTSVMSDTGELETGLVLLPFSGWDGQGYRSGVQIFTFSDTSLTKRGVMLQDTQVRRSFVADRSNNTTGNLSESELSLFDTTDPDQPQELSRLELAPNYTQFLIFGDHGIRRHDNSSYWGWWGYQNTTVPTDTVQIVTLAGDVDGADPVAEIEVPTTAQLHKVGDLLVAVTSEYVSYNSNNNTASYDTTVDVWDLSNPAQPVHKGTLQTDALPASYYYGYGGYYGPDEAVAGFGYYYRGDQYAHVKIVDDVMVFLEYQGEQRLEGSETRTYYYPTDNLSEWQNCYDHTTYERKACTFLAGSVSCGQLTRTNGTVEDEVCIGGFQMCTVDADGERTCVDHEPTSGQTRTDTWTYDRHRYWTRTKFHPVDLANPAQPTLLSVIDGGLNNESVATLAKGDTLYYSFKRPFTVPGDSRPYVKYYFRAYDFSNRANPAATPAVNVPGELIEIDGDTAITRDFLWGQNIVETSLNKLEIRGAHAFLKGVNRFTDRQVSTVQLDGAGHVLVAHQVAWLANYNDYGYYGYENWDRTVSLAILDLDSTGFDKLGEVEVDDWANLTAAVAGRAMFQVPGGMLVINTADATKPHAQSYFPLRGWPQDVAVDGDNVYFAAGPFGLYTFDINTYNLQAAP